MKGEDAITFSLPRQIRFRSNGNEDNDQFSTFSIGLPRTCPKFRITRPKFLSLTR